ncbi:amblin-like [Rhipicephalus microplus]|uniref:amblin-like n=1 Tax=Rhipicephalus microplus TaxID=6941 RepID=UPI003F6B0739
MRLRACCLVVLACVLYVYAARGKKGARCSKIPTNLRVPCRRNARFWFFDFALQTCKMYLSGRCGGANDHFASERMCQKVCLPPERQKLSCSVVPKQGPCHKGSRNTWYFNFAAGLCTRILSANCSVGANSFPSCEACTKSCTNANSQEACSRAVPNPEDFLPKKPK